ncbi:MAG: DNA polymerase III subunit chi [Magnetococcales bacterium]|nr:DNA polymerase III subunit chi [Magnetococcales bacterium]
MARTIEEIPPTDSPPTDSPSIVRPPIVRPPIVRFYQAVAGVDLFKLIAGLAAKALERGMRLDVVTSNPEQAHFLDQFLWRYPDDSFLPHGLDNEPDPERQPLLIGTAPQDQNGATVLIVANSRPVDNPGQFDLVIDFAHDKSHVDQEIHLASRQRYSHYQKLGCTMEYWVQKSSGGWERKA